MNVKGSSRSVVLAALAAASLAAACRAPRYAVTGEYGTVSVPEEFGPEAAGRVVRALDHSAPNVAQFLKVPVERGIPVRVTSARFLSEKHQVCGQVVGRPLREIQLSAVCLEDPGLLALAMAHELAHWHMLESSWQALPYMIQEAMAEFLGACRYPRGIVFLGNIDEIESQGIEPSPEVLDLTREDMDRMSRVERRRWELVAYEFLRRLGFHEIVGMVERGETGREDLLGALRPAP